MASIALSLPRALRLRARQAHLDRSGTDAFGVTSALAALHATDPATLHLSVWARLPLAPVAEVVAATRRTVEEHRRVVRVLAMRRTLHGVPASLVPAALALARARLDGPQRKRLDPLLVAAKLATPRTVDRAFQQVCDEVLGALDGVDLDTDALGERVPALRLRVLMGEGKSYATEMPLSRFVLEAMGNLGLVIRAREVGGWRVGRCTWARLDQWLPGLPSRTTAQAYADLLRAWLAAFGPGAPEDAAWWTGLPRRDIERARQDLGDELTEVTVEGAAGPLWMLSSASLDGLDTPLPPAFLPGLDPSIMACKDRSLFLDARWLPQLFDRNGNAGPTIWLDGRVAGGWACNREGQVTFRLLETTDKKTRKQVEDEARRLQEALAGEIVQPRYPVPLSKDLAAS